MVDEAKIREFEGILAQKIKAANEANNKIR